MTFQSEKVCIPQIGEPWRVVQVERRSGLRAELRRNQRSAVIRKADQPLIEGTKDRKGHISRKAVRAEYNRLVLEKYANDKA